MYSCDMYSYGSIHSRPHALIDHAYAPMSQGRLTHPKTPYSTHGRAIAALYIKCEFNGHTPKTRYSLDCRCGARSMSISTTQNTYFGCTSQIHLDNPHRICSGKSVGPPQKHRIIVRANVSHNWRTAPKTS